MAAGTHYDLKPDYKPEEFYRVETGVRKSGPWKLDIANLVVGSFLPVFTPVQADSVKRTLIPVRNVKVVEAYTTCLLYTSPSPRDRQKSRMPSSA